MRVNTCLVRAQYTENSATISRRRILRSRIFRRIDFYRTEISPYEVVAVLSVRRTENHRAKFSPWGIFAVR